MSKKTNLERDNFKPFKQRIFKNLLKPISPDIFDFKDIIEFRTNNNLLPLIPVIYFKKNDLDITDNIGSEIINNYYTIKILLKKLEKIKKIILDIIDTSRSEFEKINVSREKYKLNKDNLVHPFENYKTGDIFKIDREKFDFEFHPEHLFKKDYESIFENQDEFIEFVDKFIYYGNRTDDIENYSLFKNSNDKYPYFYKIFQNEYKGKSKTYFVNLFKKYFELRKIILKQVRENHGLLAFTLFFDLTASKNYQKMKEEEALKKSMSTNEYNNYILYGMNSMNRDEYEIGDIVRKKNKSPNEDFKIIKYNNSYNKYLLKQLFHPYNEYYVLSIDLDNFYKIIYKHIDDNFKVGDIITKLFGTMSELLRNYQILKINPTDLNKKYYIKELTYNKEKYYSDLEFKQNFRTSIKKITKRDLGGKIHNFDLLYVNIIDQEYYKNEHMNNIYRIYDNFYNSIQNIIGYSVKSNLYNFLINSFEMDFYLIKFIFYYVDQKDFNKAVDDHYNCKKYISKSINNFERYYDDYIDWYNMFIGTYQDVKLLYSATSESDFKEFFDTIYAKNIET
jgi:hypothetical protein